MRIVGQVEHPIYKITLLHMNNRFDIKIEHIGMEQHYKIRESNQFNSADAVKKALNDQFFKEVDAVFVKMSSNFKNILTEEDENQMLSGVI